MLVYKDIITGEELFSDSYRMEEVNELYYKVTGKMHSESTQVSDAMFGGNASAEGGGEDFEADVKRGVNIILAHHLKEINSLDRKSYVVLFKEYAKKLHEYYKTNLPDKLEEYSKQCPVFLKEIKKVLKDEEFQFFQSEAATGEGLIALLGYEEDGLTPYMIFFKYGLIEEKQ